MYRAPQTFIVTLAVAATFGLAVSAQANLLEDFESITDGALINTDPNWDGTQAGTGPAVRQTSHVPALGTAGYNSTQGLEYRNQHDARRMLTAQEIVSAEDATNFAFEAKVRVASVKDNGTAETGNHSFALVIGENIGWDSSTFKQEKLDLSNTIGFAVLFYNSGGTTSIETTNGSEAFELVTDSSATTDRSAIDDSTWSFDTWYTVRLSNFNLGDGTDVTNITAELDIINTDTSAVLIDGESVKANKGGATTTAGAFDMLDSFAFTNVRGNGMASVDDVSLAVIPEPASMVLMGLGGLLLLRRRATH